MSKRETAAKKIRGLLSTESSSYWMDVREKESLKLFKRAAKNIPAYKDFLKKHNVSPEDINTWGDFQTVPKTSKKNYLKEYPLNALCWEGTLNSPMVFTATSGSTGEPFYFLRSEALDWQYSVIIEDYLERGGVSENSPTLVVICFGMGLWIGGLITYKAFEIASNRKNYGLSLITPGFNKKEIFNILRNLSPKYKQTILVGYPPFIKDIVDESSALGIDLQSLNIRFLFAAESISEEFRDYLFKRAGVRNKYIDFMNIYGSADIGAMAVETTSGILIRRLAAKNQDLFTSIFSPIQKTPTLAQFNPLFTNFESVDSEILITGDSAIPLIRYSIGDNGGVMSFDDAVNKVNSFGFDFESESKKAGIDMHISKTPFVFVYERADFSTSFYGLLIYPEWIKTVLYSDDAVKYLTGKFTMSTKNDSAQNQYLEINLELKKDTRKTVEFEKRLQKAIIQNLQKVSSEYREIYKGLGEFANPRLVFWPAEDPLYFKTGIKQKWVEK